VKRRLIGWRGYALAAGIGFVAGAAWMALRG
jgi:hypothetical protein